MTDLKNKVINIQERKTISNGTNPACTLETYIIRTMYAVVTYIIYM